MLGVVSYHLLQPYRDWPYWGMSGKTKVTVAISPEAQLPPRLCPSSCFSSTPCSSQAQATLAQLEALGSRLAIKVPRPYQGWTGHGKAHFTDGQGDIMMVLLKSLRRIPAHVDGSSYDLARILRDPKGGEARGG